MNDFDIENIRVEILKKTNEYRKRHQANPLVLDPEINNYAQEWAEKLIKKNVLAHRPNNKYGENIAMISSPNLVHCIDLWYDEVKNYDYNSLDTNFKSLHFTQLVWTSSKKVGFGIAKNSSTYVVVANFDPKGNILKKFNENVLPPV
uniref:SCP domain-containing protein n=1 Tax=Strongyloides papillosus TaxID=174720 RepID=A0A0N5B6R6_STREA